ncbi:hypothetical protein AAHE18_09G089300 [Arachis hypogaea]
MLLREMSIAKLKPLSSPVISWGPNRNKNVPRVNYQNVTTSGSVGTSIIKMNFMGFNFILYHGRKQNHKLSHRKLKKKLEKKRKKEKEDGNIHLGLMINLI